VDQLYFSLYQDEDVHVLVAELIRARDFSALTTQEAGQLGQDDSSQLQHAIQNGRAILTHNRNDFERLARSYAETGQSHFGIIIAVRRSPYELAQRLLRLLNTHTADEMQNQVIYI
jgi:hypothetical protein